MATTFEFISASDKPALVGAATAAWQEAVQAALTGMGCKVHAAATAEEFLTRFSQVQYQVVVLEETFAAPSLGENAALKALQVMPMAQRRHAAVFLVGSNFQTLSSMQAFQHSVTAVINISEIGMLRQLLEKAIADNDGFYAFYRETQKRGAAAPPAGH